MQLQVTTASNGRRLLDVTAKYEVLINTTADADADALSTVAEVLQNVTKATQNLTDASEIAWCGDFCTTHASSIDVQQTGTSQ
jgi:endonuclease IV